MKKKNTNSSSSSAGPLRAKAGIDTRKEILDAAARIFSENGYKAASMRAISDLVGIQPPSVYAHFKSKNEILYTVVEDAMTKLLAMCEDRLGKEESNDPTDKLRAFVKAHVDIELEMRDVVPLMDSQLFRGAGLGIGLNETQREELAGIQRKVVELLRDILSDGKNMGKMHFNDLTVTTFAILGIIEHVAYWFRPEGRLSADEVSSEISLLALATAQTENSD